jgi:hypothetical protein
MGTSKPKRKTAAEYKKMLSPQPSPNCPECRGRDGKFKVAYRNAPEAARACQEYKSAQWKSDPERDRMNVYPCPKGHGFHIGHGKPPRSAPARPARTAPSHSKGIERIESNRIAKDFRPPPEWFREEPERAAGPARSSVTSKGNNGKSRRK